MRTIQRVAYVFSLTSLFFGITGFFGPLVDGNRDRWLNIHSGKQFGLFATNWVHSLSHIVMGLPGLIPQVRERYARIYMGALTTLFALFAGMGWIQSGMKSGVYKTMGMAQNREDNIMHTVMAATGLLFTLMPDLRLRRLPAEFEVQDLRKTTNRAMEKVRKEAVEKMPV